MNEPAYAHTDEDERIINELKDMSMELHGEYCKKAAQVMVAGMPPDVALNGVAEIMSVGVAGLMIGMRVALGLPKGDARVKYIANEVANRIKKGL